MAVAALLSLLVCASACQHARVQIKDSVLAVPECATYEADKTNNYKQIECARAKDRLRAARASAAKPVELGHNFFFWGLYPKQVTLKANEVCPGGVQEIYAFSTWKDELLDNLTAGIYCPRTIRITCATELKL